MGHAFNHQFWTNVANELLGPNNAANALNVDNFENEELRAEIQRLQQENQNLRIEAQNAANLEVQRLELEIRNLRVEVQNERDQRIHAQNQAVPAQNDDVQRRKALFKKPFELVFIVVVVLFALYIFFVVVPTIPLPHDYPLPFSPQVLILGSSIVLCIILNELIKKSIGLILLGVAAVTLSSSYSGILHHEKAVFWSWQYLPPFISFGLSVILLFGGAVLIIISFCM